MNHINYIHKIKEMCHFPRMSKKTPTKANLLRFGNLLLQMIPWELHEGSTLHY